MLVFAGGLIACFHRFYINSLGVGGFVLINFSSLVYLHRWECDGRICLVEGVLPNPLCTAFQWIFPWMGEQRRDLEQSSPWS